MLVKVNGTNMVRDTSSMALLNTDNTEKNEYYAKVRMMQNQKTEINNVKSEIQSIKDDISEVKQLLAKLLEGTNV